MRLFSPLLLAVALLGTSGCESVSNRMKERFATVEPQMRIYAVTPATVREAAVAAFRQLDWRITRNRSVAIEAASRINTSAAFGDSRQILAELNLRETQPGQTEVSLLLTGQSEGDSVSSRSQQPLKENAFYDIYFATLQQILVAPVTH